MQPGGSNPSGNVPQAFLTVIFFDERFNFIPAADGGVVQQQVAASVGSNGSSLTLANIKAPKNGYAFIYISNQSNNDVYFDNLQVGIVQGNIAEENHYYSYGLKIATLSSKKLGDTYEGTLKNNYLYNDKELFDDADLNWYDYGFRNYDPQIGRFTQLDPLTDEYPFLTPYQYASCEPIANIDIDGLEGWSAIIHGTVTAASGTEKGASLLGKIAGTATMTIKAGNAIASVSASRNGRDKTYVYNNHVYSFKHYNNNNEEDNLSEYIDITQNALEYADIITEIGGKDKLNIILKSGQRVFLVGGIVNDVANKDVGGLLGKGLDYIFRNNGYYFFITQIVRSSFVKNQAATDLWMIYLDAKVKAVAASRERNDARKKFEASSTEDNRKDWLEKEEIFNELNEDAAKKWNDLENFMKQNYRDKPGKPVIRKDEIRPSDY